MAQMTEEEAEYWDDYFTKNPPKVDPAKKGTGFFTRRKTLMDLRSTRTITVDTLSADYLTTKAIATHKTPAEIIGDLVRKELKAAY
jgi:hypothetical protein